MFDEFLVGLDVRQWTEHPFAAVPELWPRLRGVRSALQRGHGDGYVTAVLRTALSDDIGKFARPDAVIWADALPKSRSGKIMRRLLARLAAGDTEVGDVTTLEDAGVLEKLRNAESDED